MIGYPRPQVVPTMLVTLGLLVSGCAGSSDGGGATAGSTSSVTMSSEPDDAGSSRPRHLVGDDSQLTPGTYQFSFLANPGVETPDALVEVPSGFDDGAEWYVVSDDGDAFLGLWTVGQVRRDACLGTPDDHVTPGPSVEDLADALVAQESTSASAPEQVSVAGYEALYIELDSPSDISTCSPTPHCGATRTHAGSTATTRSIRCGSSMSTGSASWSTQRTDPSPPLWNAANSPPWSNPWSSWRRDSSDVAGEAHS